MSSFYDNVKLNEMSSQAESELLNLKTVCENIDSSLESIAKKGSLLRRIGSIFGTILWAIIYSAIFAFVPEAILSNISILFFILVVLYLFVKIIDICGDFSYYGKIFGLRSQISSINKKIDKNRTSLEMTRGKLTSSIVNGWKYKFDIAEPIINEAEKVKSKASKLEVRDRGVINKIMTLLFYTISLVMTVFVSFALYETAYRLSSDLLYNVFSWDMSQKVCYIILSVILVISCMAEIFISTVMARVTDKVITNVTMLATLAGPLIFVIIVAAVLLVVVLIVIVLLLGIIALALACTCGG